jgi:hypothetical protein
MKNEEKVLDGTPVVKGRREFLKLSGLAVAGTGLLLAGCNNDDDNNNNNDDQLPGVRNGVFDFGGGDLGIMTYAYALEQLEAAFSTQVVNASQFTTTWSAEEQQMMMDIYSHEVIHREFFRNLLTTTLPNSSTQLLPDLQFDFSSVDFNDRTAVLNTAMLLEETGIAAYNGAGKLLDSADNLNMAGRIVSVEGRHASAIRSMIDPASDQFAPNPLDPATPPSQILTVINQTNFITTDFTATYLP